MVVYIEQESRSQKDKVKGRSGVLMLLGPLQSTRKKAAGDSRQRFGTLHTRMPYIKLARLLDQIVHLRGVRVGLNQRTT